MRKRILKKIVIILVVLISTQAAGLQINTDNQKISYNNDDLTVSSSILIIIKNTLFTSLKDHLNIYIQDLSNEGFDVEIHQIPDTYTNDHIGQIKTILQNAYEEDNINGCLLIGDIPIMYVSSDNSFISDFFYMDLDGTWIDEDQDGIYEIHEGNKDLEIWVARLCSPNKENEIIILKNYFRKNHAYRKGNINFPDRALYYETRHDQWHDPSIEQEYLTNLEMLYDTIVFVAPWEGNPSPDDYLVQLTEGFEFIYLHSWSTATSHTFTNGRIQYNEITEIDPYALFYLLSACNTGNIEKENYIAGSYVFSETYGLTALAPTTSSYDYPIWLYQDFIEALTIDTSVGNAFLQHKNNRIFDLDGICSFYSHLIIGDPTIQVTKSYGPASDNNPPQIPCINGPDSGKIDEEYSFEISSIDPDLDRISFLIEWGDETNNNTLSLIQSGENEYINHIWTRKETYEIKVQAIDEHGLESQWASHQITMSKNKQVFYTFFLKNFPLLSTFPLLLKIKEELKNDK